MKSLILAFTVAVVAASAAHSADGDAPDRQQRWKDLAQYVFGDKKLEATDTVISLDAPKRAEDAALVPMTIKIDPKTPVTGADLIIDDNPAPVAARIQFGPAADPRLMKLRVRINGYTNIHAIVETKDGELFQSTRFVKASGGCSAPMGVSDDEAMKGMGEMRMRFGVDAEAGGAPEATLMIRHPNFNGMQMNLITRAYTPPRYVKSIEVSLGDQKVFSIESDISMSTDPVISFLYKAEQTGAFHVTVKDTEGATWSQDFDARRATN